MTGGSYRGTPLEARLTLTRRAADCALVALDCELQLADSLALMLAALPDPTRARVRLTRDGGADGGGGGEADDAADVDRWVRDAAAAAKSAGVWGRLHKWVSGDADRDLEPVVGRKLSSAEKRARREVAKRRAAERVEALFAELDDDGSGALDYDEVTGPAYGPAPSLSLSLSRAGVGSLGPPPSLSPVDDDERVPHAALALCDPALGRRL